MSIYATYNDEQLIVLLTGNDRQIFEEVFHRYNKRLFPHVLKFVRSPHAAEEIIQEVFIRLWLNREIVSTMDNPTAWLFRVASNLSLDFLRKADNQKKILDRLLKAGIAAPASSSTEEYILSREYDELLHRAIDNLSPQKQLIYKLSREEGMSHSQISQKLNISSSTVNNQLVSALSYIRIYMKKAGISMSILFFL